MEDWRAIVALLAAGIAIGTGLYYVVVRLMEPSRRRADTRWQLQEAQQKEHQRRVVAGPAFPRAYLHVLRIRDRAEALTQRMDEAVWLDHEMHEMSMEDMRDLLRHCHELADVMKPKPKPREPE